ncbi:hypothetical protein DM806_16510 [Sphingobium lactosutens]|uniref:hypothetical protein n=1 Tax=Sphingobium lactosutens TaxID=522773 RepID=UPI0015BDAD8B|nr:hypothetical protein [Sphingobium lactosutens]NWK97242.1 hypothetical protein [Sphingobium lactosutens]
MRSFLRSQVLRSLVIITTAVVAVQLVSHLIGFGVWVDTNSTARFVWRSFAILLFSAMGFWALFGSHSDDLEMRPAFYRLIGVLFVVIAVIHATILFGDPLDLVSE